MSSKILYLYDAYWSQPFIIQTTWLEDHSVVSDSVKETNENIKKNIQLMYEYDANWNNNIVIEEEWKKN